MATCVSWVNMNQGREERAQDLDTLMTKVVRDLEDHWVYKFINVGNSVTSYLKYFQD